jgi:hypothetical protein
MSRVGSYMNQENLQTEVAILQKKILAFKPCYARLYIPAIMGDDTDKYISVPMPVHLAITYGDNVIPEGTKLIVQTVAGNYNDIRIIGYYDEPKPFNFIAFIKNYIDGKDYSLPDDYRLFDYDEI